MLRYTGHPLFDVGAATIAAYVGKPNPSTLTEQDLERMADYMLRNYVVAPLKSFLHTAFPNSAYTNPAFEKTPGAREERARPLLWAFRAGPSESDELCPFTAQPVASVAFSSKGPSGRAFRQHVPLVLGEGYVNFYPGGDAGLPVSGPAMLCLQALPLGCAYCAGRLLAVHSSNPEVTYDFAREFLHTNMNAVTLAQQSGSTKLRPAGASARTLLIHTLLEAEARHREEAREERSSSITAYHLTNYGQANALDARNPPLQIYHLPAQMTGFLRQVVTPSYRQEWQRLVARAWRQPAPQASSRKGDESDGTDEHPRLNFLYEDLFRLPDNARSFVRCYFLRLPIKTRFADDPRHSYSLRDEAGLVSWKLVQLFLQRVMHMDTDRIEEIRNLGDRLATYVQQENDRRFFNTFAIEQRYSYLRTALIKANLSHVRRGHPPLIALDPYLTVFEDAPEAAVSDWRLARDLVLIRVVELLYQQGWIGANRDSIAVPELEGESTQ